MLNIASVVSRIVDPEVRVVSFDLFDTLIRRYLTKPEHLFWFMEPALLERGYDKAWVAQFGNARSAAGSRAVCHAHLYGKEDFGIEVIYEIIGTLIPEASVALREIKELELSLERRFLEPYPLGVLLFAEAKRAGKRIVICSDQYLPKLFLKTLLIDNDIMGFEHLFLSGDDGISKASGSLYKALPGLLGVEAQHILHIGDNRHVDIEVAEACGIPAIEIPQSLDVDFSSGRKTAAARCTCLGSIATAMYLHARSDAIVIEQKALHFNDVEFLGYTFYGPLLVYIARWLVEKVKKGDVEKILLLARDSEGLSKVIPLLFPEYKDYFEYVYASRRILVYSSSNITAVEINRHYGDLLNSSILAHDFIDYVSGSTADFSMLKSAFLSDCRLNEPGTREKMLDLFSSHLSTSSISVDALRHRERIGSYYKAKASGSTRLGIFDIGWRGNLQRSLEEILGGDFSITGFYLGSIYEEQVPKRFVASASFAFNNNFPFDVFEDIEPNLWPLELIFGGTEASAVDVVEEGGLWRPRFDEQSLAKAQLSKTAERLQEAAVKFVEDARTWDKELLLILADRGQGITMMREFLARPSAKDAGTLAQFSWTAEIDQSEGKLLIAKPEDRSRKSIMEARNASSWRAGFDALLTPQERRGQHRYRYRNAFDKLVPIEETFERIAHLWNRLSSRILSSE